MGLQGLVIDLLANVGIERVSVIALVVLGSVALYAHKLTKVGGVAGQGVRDVKFAAVLLGALAVAGLISIDVERSQEVFRLAIERLPDVLAWLQ